MAVREAGSGLRGTAKRGQAFSGGGACAGLVVMAGQFVNMLKNTQRVSFILCELDLKF